MLLAITPLKAAVPSIDILIQDGDLTVSKEDALLMLDDMNPTQRKRILSNEGKFKELLLDLLIVKKKVLEAKKQKIDQQKNIQWKVKKAENRILADQLISEYQKTIKPPQELEALAKESYESHPEKYLIKEKIKAAHILISTSDAKDADAKAKKLESLKKIVQQVKEGKLTFEDAAKKYSDDTGSAKSGGVINYFTRGKMVKPFEDAAFSLKNKDDLSDIIESQFGYHVIKLIDHAKESTRPFDKVKTLLISREKTKYTNAKVEAYSDSFIETKDTTVYMKSIQDLIVDANK
ncbi:MAG: peptidylprolyl isomerase [Sulfurovaceae bacterium]|nr:peptidylprolyl isomerase [Sulfurovaceae bacterium]